MRTTTRPPATRRRAAIAAGAGLITAAALLLGGCGSSTTTDGSATSSDLMPSMSNMPAVPSATGEITISDFEFKVPESVTPGETLTIRNNDSTEHSVTADASGSFSVDIPANGTATMTAPDQAGTFAFHCKYHSSMHGKLTVS
ncbi:cupredoxin domain-containing protein [Tomitella biformata]|uniref:cupredoxin domain-containing protein n=1 Tax=Tomitella biformata TaxID=630403 RepID=UPI00046499D8|nr:cupredoxin domain-containing protein [Tomitella biformata]